jgi:hypothetical protein
MSRYVQIRSRLLTQPFGTILSQERLGMSDEKLDEFIAAGFAIEVDVEEPTPKRRTRKAT